MAPGIGDGEGSVTPAQIRRIAQAVRDEFDECIYLCNRTSTGRKCLCGRCEDVSIVVHQRLVKRGLRARLRAGYFLRPRAQPEAHVWVTLGGHILDATATQFGAYPAVWFPANPRRYMSLMDGIAELATAAVSPKRRS